jgi:sugar diacid utilization regulator
MSQVPKLQSAFISWCENNFFPYRSSERSPHTQRNTLNYRLDKISRTGNINLKNCRETMKLYLAFRLEKFIGPGLQEGKFPS